MVYCIHTTVHPCTTTVQFTQHNLKVVAWYAMEYDGTSSYHHGTNILHPGMLWFAMVQPLLKYTIIHQNLGYHGAI